MKALTLPVGYERRVPLDLAQPCWPSTSRASHGYGVVMIDGETKYRHRVSYQLHVGPIPRGWEVDHVCHSAAVEAGTCEGGACVHTGCWNPAHLETVTSAENSARGNHPLFAIARSNRCRRDHDLTDPAYVYTRPDGRRRCRRCQLDGQKARRSSKR